MKYVLKQLTTYFKEHKVRYTFVFVFMVIASAMYVAPIYILRLFIDALIQDNFDYSVLIQYVSLFAGATFSKWGRRFTIVSEQVI